MTYKSGFVALLGRPNVGKSTLVNRLAGSRVAAVSPKPQTTRTRIRAIVTTDDAQLVLVDTPGIHRPRTKLGAAMVRTAQLSALDVDNIWHVVDLTREPGPEEQWVASSLQRYDAPVWLVANKVDRVDDWRLKAASFRTLFPYAAVYPISALTGEGVDDLLEEALRALPEGPQLFDADQVTDQAEDFYIAEVVREKVLELTRDEVPHAVAVVVDEKVARRPDLTYIRATLYVERESQRGILVGEGGRMSREIGRRARLDLEEYFGHQVFLEIWVKAEKGWRDREDWLRRFGLHSRGSG
jgi:GTP-binding protein Era